MNEFKIQLDSQEDVLFIFEQLEKYAEKNIGKYTSKYPNINKVVQQIMSRTLECMASNVQINGCDWSPSQRMAEVEYEPIDENLCKELEKTISDVDDLLLKVANCRREYPEKYEKIALENKGREISSYLEKINEITNHEANETENKLKEVQWKNETLLTDSFDKYTKSLPLLKELSQRLPQLTAKLERASTVLEDESMKRLNTEPEESFTPIIKRLRAQNMSAFNSPAATTTNPTTQTPSKGAFQTPKAVNRRETNFKSPRNSPRASPRLRTSTNANSPLTRKMDTKNSHPLKRQI